MIHTEHASVTLTNALPAIKTLNSIFVWSYTTTPVNPASWSAPLYTVESKVTLTGLTPETRGYFRQAIILPQGRNPILDVAESQIVWGPDIISAFIL